MERSHGEVVGAAVMDSELLCKVVQRIERMAGIEALLVLAVAALHFAVVPRRIWTNQLMPNTKFGSRPLKQRRLLALTAGEAVGKLGTVVRLDTLHLDPAARIPRGQSAKEIGRRIGGLLRIGGEEAQARELVDGGVLEQPKLRIRDAFPRHDLHIHLHALSGMGHLLVRLGFVCIFRLFGRKQAHFAHDTEQAFRAACIAALPQAVPELDHAQGWISAAHVADELQLGLCVLVWMAMRSSGLAGQGCHTSIPALLPEVDVRPALVVLPAGAADAVFLCVLH